MTTARAGPAKCSNCGAAASRLDARFCEYCGTAFPLLPAQPPASRADVAARFRALESQPELSKLMSATPDASKLTSQVAVTVIALVVFGLVGLFVALGFFFVCPPLGLLPLALIGIGIYTLSKEITRTRSASRAPLERRPALVVDERTKISGGSEHSDARPEYYATLEFPDGSRAELETLDSVAGEIAPGDMGVAYLKGKYLIAFGRLSV